jgi:hypothetical protein
MRSILHQLLQIETMTPTVQQRIETIIGVDGDINEPNTLIVETCSYQSHVFVIIDGIDEAGQEERRVIFRFLKNILKNLPTCKFFIVSQPEVDIAAIYSSWQAISNRAI